MRSHSYFTNFSSKDPPLQLQLLPLDISDSLMELAIVQTVYSLAVGITNFIAEHDDKNAVNEQISNIVVQIQNIIHPLLSRRITNPPLQQCLQNLQSVLSNTHEHMKMWREGRFRRLLALVNPRAVTQQLKDDREQLMVQYIMLMGAMQIVDHIKGYNLITPPPKVDRSPPQEKKKGEVFDFWEQCIGSQSWSAKAADLCEQLSSWLGIKLDSTARQRLLLRLDHENTGYVTLAALHDLVQKGNIKEVINAYSAEPTLPLLIWIDDDIVGNTSHVLRARKAGISVVQIGSTCAAKKWIHISREFLKKHDNPADIRFASDQVRTEFNPEGVSYKNLRAGEEMTKFIRKEGFLAPILIFTSRWGIQRTRYVEAYSMVGSLADWKKFHEYVDALGARRKDDTQWVKYGGP